MSDVAVCAALVVVIGVGVVRIVRARRVLAERAMLERMWAA